MTLRSKIVSVDEANKKAYVNNEKFFDEKHNFYGKDKNVSNMAYAELRNSYRDVRDALKESYRVFMSGLTAEIKRIEDYENFLRNNTDENLTNEIIQDKNEDI